MMTPHPPFGHLPLKGKARHLIRPSGTCLGYRKESHALWAAARSPLRKSHWLFLRVLRTRGR